MKILDAYKFCPQCGQEFSLVEDHLECVNGHRFYESPKPGVNAIIFDNGGKLLLAKRKIDPWKNFWYLPGGFVKPEETADQAIEREVMEELGTKLVEKELITTVAEKYPYKGINYEILKLVFVGKIEVDKIVPGDDAAEVSFVDFNHALSLKLGSIDSDILHLYDSKYKSHR